MPLAPTFGTPGSQGVGRVPVDQSAPQPQATAGTATAAGVQQAAATSGGPPPPQPAPAAPQAPAQQPGWQGSPFGPSLVDQVPAMPTSTLGAQPLPAPGSGLMAQSGAPLRSDVKAAAIATRAAAAALRGKTLKRAAAPKAGAKTIGKQAAASGGGKVGKTAGTSGAAGRRAAAGPTSKTASSGRVLTIPANTPKPSLGTRAARAAASVLGKELTGQDDDGDASEKTAIRKSFNGLEISSAGDGSRKFSKVEGDVQGAAAWPKHWRGKKKS